MTLVAVSAPLATPAAAPPSLSVSGGLQTQSGLQPLIFTWNSPVPLQGSGWAPGETVSLALEGPLNSPGVAAGEVALGTVTADGQGAFSASPAIPYDGGATGPQTQIPRPGSYQVRATGAVSGAISAAWRINLAPATYTGGGPGIDWSHERGTRIGVLPGPLSAYSPERSDPNWISVWDSRPVEIYGQVASAQSDGDSQPARISYEDDPLTHYAHDTNFYVIPDPQYRWTVGTANYYSNGEDEGGGALGRIEVEWESLNSGNTTSYGTGQIGIPDWAVPAAGDRIYAVGRWVLDAGHPESGDRSEMHPPRLVAVMRKRPAASSTMAASSQVDILISGHGGGANRFPAGMDALLSQGGHGGGRMRDVLSAADQQTYYQPGPLPGLELPLVNLLVQQISGQPLSAPIYAQAGPTAFSWGTPAPEQQPINDMDYDFDVPLPAMPGASGSPQIEVVTHAEHTSSVTERITYSASAAGPIAHIHIPYNGADNGIYARTLKFVWSRPVRLNHFQVTLNRLTPKSLTGKWHVWAEVSGQWKYLPALAPALLATSQQQAIDLPGAQFDVYPRDSDTLRILVQGYHATCVDGLFATFFGTGSYSAGIQLLTNCGPVNNDDLGGALLELPALPSSQGSYVVQADKAGQAGAGAFQVAVTVTYVNPPTVSAECQGRGALTPGIAASGIVGAGLSQPRSTRISPDGLISVFGQGFAPSGVSRGVTAADAQNGTLPVNLGCTCVAVNQGLAPILFVSPSQVNFQAPLSAVASGAVQVIANCGAAGEAKSASQTAPAQPVAPEFFFFTQDAKGAGPVAAANAVTGAPIGANTPAKPGDYVALYVTGLGLTDPALPEGALAPGPVQTSFPVSVTLNNAKLPPGDVLYAGAAPGFAGLYQINIQIPPDAPDGDLPIALNIAGVSTPTGAFLTVHR